MPPQPDPSRYVVPAVSPDSIMSTTAKTATLMRALKQVTPQKVSNPVMISMTFNSDITYVNKFFFNSDHCTVFAHQQKVTHFLQPFKKSVEDLVDLCVAKSLDIRTSFNKGARFPQFVMHPQDINV